MMSSMIGWLVREQIDANERMICQAEESGEMDERRTVNLQKLRGSLEFLYDILDSLHFITIPTDRQPRIQRQGA